VIKDGMMEAVKWQTQKVHGRDEVLQGIEDRASGYRDAVVQDARAIMHDYEVDMYRLVLAVGKRCGMDSAYEIMSETVADKRLRWLDQVSGELALGGTEVEKGLGLYLKYFHPKDEDFKIVEQTGERVVFRRRDYVDAIFYACDALGLDVIEVNNKVYARATDRMFARLGLRLKHVFLKCEGGWYDEMLQVCAPD
jgi:hypothetical protein